MIRLLQYLSRILPLCKVIPGRGDSNPYLTRWHLAPSAYLHHIHREDDDFALHSHPYTWSWILILAGGYMEDIRVGDRVHTRLRRPWSVQVIRPDDYHRIAYVPPDGSWSIFVHGPRRHRWYFWNPRTCMRMWERLFLASKRAGVDPWSHMKGSREYAMTTVDRREP